jgi:outer membrane protein OmpA-like peptidoglycan-associated protein
LSAFSFSSHEEDMTETFNRPRRGIILKSLAASLCAAIASGCATDPVTRQPSLKETFASEDPCSNNARNIGIGVGLLAGVIVGNQFGSSGESRMIGAALGATAGGLIGADMDRRRCELSKIARTFNLDLQVSTVNAAGEVIDDANLKSSGNAADIRKNAIGSVTEIRNQEEAGGHFESNSDQLTPRARQYFSAIADAYNAKKTADQIRDPKLRTEYIARGSRRKILLVGHTDDTGSSTLNADLSERRAKAVSRLMEGRGIPRESLYFQGAGESYPIADNNSEIGRTKNRRVEIIEVADKENFEKYLEARKPRYEFYRPKEVAVAKGPHPLPSQAASHTDKKEDPPTKAIAAQGNPIDFGGVPLSQAIAIADIGKIEPRKPFFSLISTAHAAEPAVISDCTRDRPRVANGVKSLADGSTYRTSEHIPGLYGKTWTDQVNGHQIVINKVAVLAADGSLANLPEFKVYTNYDASKNRNAAPDLAMRPDVNTYLGSRGVLYRMFINGRAGLECVDVVFANDGGTLAKAGKLVYTHAAKPYVADFKPKMY